MSDARWWRWGGLALIGVVAAVFASFNTDERVALNVGFAVVYQIPLVPLIFAAFLVGMATMFLLGLRHDIRVRKALREAGFGEPIATGDAVITPDDSRVEESTSSWGQELRSPALEEDPDWTVRRGSPKSEDAVLSSEPEPEGRSLGEPPPPDAEPPPRSPP